MRLLLVWDAPGAPGAHVRCRVFSGADADHMALNGTLVFAEDEAASLRSALDHWGSLGPDWHLDQRQS